MIKRILLALFVLAPIAAMAQGACYPGLVLLDTGRPANAASVRVCTQGSTGTPCTPAASLFSDPALSLPIATSPTLTTDSRGNFAFCATPANYDLQISGTGITTFKVSNLTLPAAAPITAATLTSSSASPATVGLVKLASGDCVDWRNNANTGNDQLCKTAAASGNVPADTLDLTAFGAVRALSWVSGTANPAASGAVALASGDCVKFRNNANSADLSGVCKNASDQVLLGSGPVIVPVANDTAVLLAAPQTLTNKTLTSPTSTGTDNGTETLQQKTLQGAGSGNAVTLLNAQGVQANVTGNSTDQTLFTFTVPANTIGAGKGIQVKTCIKNNNAVAVTQKFFFGATSFTVPSSAVSGTSQCYTVAVINNPASQTGQVWKVLVLDGSTISVMNADVTSAENTANALTVKITGNEASPNTVAPRMWTVELIQ